MAYWIVLQAESHERASAGEIFDLVYVTLVGFVVRAIVHPKRINFSHQLLRLRLPADIGQQAADLRREGQLAIAKGARASPPGHQRAGGALHAAALFP